MVETEPRTATERAAGPRHARGAVTIRRITPADASKARALRIEMLADNPLAFITTVADAAALPHAEYVGRATRSARGSQAAQFVAEVDGRFVATVGAFAHPGDETRTVLIGVYVTPAHRGSGTPGALVDAAAAWSRECGRPTLELEVVTTNGRARRAYTKLGFLDDGPPVPHPTVPTMREQRMARTA